MLRLGTGSRGNPNSLLAAPMLRVLRACRVGARACGQERSTLCARADAAGVLMVGSEDVLRVQHL